MEAMQVLATDRSETQPHISNEYQNYFFQLSWAQAIIETLTINEPGFLTEKAEKVSRKLIDLAEEIYKEIDFYEQHAIEQGIKLDVYAKEQLTRYVSTLVTKNWRPYPYLMPGGNDSPKDRSRLVCYYTDFLSRQLQCNSSFEDTTTPYCGSTIDRLMSVAISNGH